MFTFEAASRCHLRINQWKNNTLAKIFTLHTASAYGITQNQKRCSCKAMQFPNFHFNSDTAHKRTMKKKKMKKKKKLMEKNEKRFKSWKTYQNCYVCLCVYMFKRNKAFMSLGACENLINSPYTHELFKHFHVLLEKFCFAFCSLSTAAAAVQIAN